MKEPLVSVIIPCYNCYNYIYKTVLSVINQNYRNLEIIIINDGSSDNSVTILNQLKNTYPGTIQIVEQKNAGVSTARNNGIKIANGKYIALLDADDIWERNNLKEKIAILESNQEYKAIQSNATVIDENGQNIGQTIEGREGWLVNNILLWQPNTIVGPSGLIFNKEIINEIGYFDVNLSTAADKDFFIRIANSYLIKHLPKYTWQYRIHSNNMHKNINLMEKDELYLLNKNLTEKVFEDKTIRHNAIWKTYSVLALSFIKDANNYYKGLIYFYKLFTLAPLKTTKFIFHKLF